MLIAKGTFEYFEIDELRKMGVGAGLKTKKQRAVLPTVFSFTFLRYHVNVCVHYNEQMTKPTVCDLISVNCPYSLLLFTKALLNNRVKVSK